MLAGSQHWGFSGAPGLPPRVLAHVGLRPLIDYPLEWVWAAGARDIDICVNASVSTVREHLGDQYENLAVRYHTDLLPRGAAGCVKDAAAYSDADTFLIVEASVIPRIKALRLLDAHVRSGALMTVVTTSADDSPDDLAPAAMYVVERRALECIRPQGFQDIKENLIPQLFREGAQVITYAAPDYCPRVTNVESYLAVNQWLVEQYAAEAAGAADPAAPGHVMADASAAIDANALILGPVLIGPRVRVAAGATIVGPTVVGADTTIASGALVSRSVVGRRSTIERQASVHAAVVADGARVTTDSRLFGELAAAADHRGSWLRRLFGARPATVEPGTAPARPPMDLPRIPGSLAGDGVRGEFL